MLDYPAKAETLRLAVDESRLRPLASSPQVVNLSVSVSNAPTPLHLASQKFSLTDSTNSRILSEGSFMPSVNMRSTFPCNLFEMIHFRFFFFVAAKKKQPFPIEPPGLCLWGDGFLPSYLCCQKQVRTKKNILGWFALQQPTVNRAIIMTQLSFERQVEHHLPLQ